MAPISCGTIGRGVFRICKHEATELKCGAASTQLLQPRYCCPFTFSLFTLFISNKKQYLMSESTTSQVFKRLVITGRLQRLSIDFTSKHRTPTLPPYRTRTHSLTFLKPLTPIEAGSAAEIREVAHPRQSSIWMNLYMVRSNPVRDG